VLSSWTGWTNLRVPSTRSKPRSGSGADEIEPPTGLKPTAVRPFHNLNISRDIATVVSVIGHQDHDGRGAGCSATLGTEGLTG
jgi:hypothetical protein